MKSLGPQLLPASSCTIPAAAHILMLREGGIHITGSRRDRWEEGTERTEVRSGHLDGD